MWETEELEKVGCGDLMIRYIRTVTTIILHLRDWRMVLSAPLKIRRIMFTEHSNPHQEGMLFGKVVGLEQVKTIGVFVFTIMMLALAPVQSHQPLKLLSNVPSAYQRSLHLYPNFHNSLQTGILSHLFFRSAMHR